MDGRDHQTANSTPLAVLTPSGVQGWDEQRLIHALAAGGVVDGIVFPGGPAADVQARFVGSSGVDSMREGWAFVQRVLGEARHNGIDLDRATVLDFGAGWGRMTRCLLPFVEPSQVIAVEPMDWMAAELRTWFPGVSVETCGLRPPLRIADRSVDVLLAYSVFSHLPEALATAWIAEFARVLKPNGIAVLTTQKRSFLSFCDSLAQDATLRTSPWHEALATSFPDRAAAEADFDAGRFLHAPNGGGAELPADSYGDSVFGEAFVRTSWSELVDVLAFTDDERCAQSVMVLRPAARRSADAGSPAGLDDSTFGTARAASPSTVGHLSEDDWFAMLRASVQGRVVDGVVLPGFVDSQTQTNFVGSANEHALIEADRFWRFARRVAEGTGRPLHRGTRMLDFGTGWGRICRVFLHDIEPHGILGVDPLPFMVDACRQTFEGSGVSFQAIDPLAPTSLPAESFDLITAYSVFSHLNQSVSTAWMAEFLRLLRPGGIVVATTHDVDLLQFCRKLRAEGADESADFLWHRLLARAFGDLDDAERRYWAGEFVHAPHGGGDVLDSSYYGDSMFDLSFVQRSWAHLLEPVAFEHANGPSGLPQSAFALRKRVQVVAAPVDAMRAVADAAEIERLRRELASVTSSETWKIGRAVMYPIRKFRREI